MKTTPSQILDQWYSDLPPSVLRSLGAVLGFGKLAGTGNLAAYPVDQHWEHGWNELHGANPDSGSPEYMFRFTQESGASFLATTMDRIRPMARKWSHQIPIVAKINSSMPTGGGQLLYGSAEEAHRLGCVGIGYTLNGGSSDVEKQVTQLTALREQAHKLGLFVVVWSYPRGGKLGDDLKVHTAFDVTSRALIQGGVLGDIVKAKLPEGWMKGLVKDLTKVKDEQPAEDLTLDQRLAALKGHLPNKLVLWSGGDIEANDEGDKGYLAKVKAIGEAGFAGPIMGRKATKRPYDQAIALMAAVTEQLK
jgi:class I fructose-bisphosphate aldolase